MKDLLIQLTQQLQIQTLHLERIANALERLAPATGAAPGYQYPLELFKSFDWKAIGAEVIHRDNYGAAIVLWQGQQFVRRSPQNKFADAIWFSRCVGKDESGENKYERLVTFKALSKVEVEPVPEKVMRYVSEV